MSKRKPKIDRKSHAPLCGAGESPPVDACSCGLAAERKAKRKPKVVAPTEAWAVTSPLGGAVINFDKTIVSDGFTATRFVPADPHAKIKDAVVKAAVQWAEAVEKWKSGALAAIDPKAKFKAIDDAEIRLEAAVQKLQKVKP